MKENGINIALAADFLATSTSEQRSNLRWIRDLFVGPIARGLGTHGKVSVLSWTPIFAVDRRKFFDLSSMEFDGKSKQIFFQSEDIEDTSVQYLREILSGTDIIVGYELSLATREIIERCGIRYIDIWLHPIRFIDDLMFGFRSNDAEINASLKIFEHPEEDCYIHADLLKIQNYRGFRKFRNELRPNSALFVGQTLQDKAVASPRGMLTVLSFRDQLREIARQRDHIYYSRHPYVTEGDEAELEFIRSVRNASIIKTPTYHLLAAEEITEVVSVSSSVVTEAKYFGKACRYLLQPPVLVYSGEDSYISILHKFLFGMFWRAVFGLESPTVDMSRNLYMQNGKDKIRDSLSWYWGYREINKLEVIRANLGQLVQANKLRR